MDYERYRDPDGTMPMWAEKFKECEKFIADALESGLKVSYDYSGRGMFGDICPAVYVEEMNDLQTDTKPAWDNMGFDYVLYVK